MIEYPPSTWPRLDAADAAPRTGNEIGTILQPVARSLLRHRLLIALMGLLGMLAAITYAQLATPRHIAHAQLLVNPRDLRGFDNEVTPSGASQESGIAIVESQARVLQSENVLGRAISALNLTSDPEFNGSKRGVVGETTKTALDWFHDLTGRAEAAQDPALLTLQNLQRVVWVTRPERTYVLELSVGAEQPERSVAIAKAIVEAYLKDQAEARAAPALSVGDELDASLAGLRRKVAQSEEKIADYKTRHNLVGASGRLVNEQQLTEINNQLVAASADLERSKVRHEEAQRLKNAPETIPEALNSATLRALRNQLAQLVAQKARLAAQMKPQHPAMSSFNEQEQQLRGLVREELQRIVKAAGIEYERAQAVEKSLAKSVEQLRQQMNSSNEAQIALRELESELNANRTIYQAATVRAREAREQARLNTANVRVIAEPTPERTRSSPPPLRLLLPAGLVLGLGLGGLLALARDGIDFARPDNRRQDPGQRAPSRTTLTTHRTANHDRTPDTTQTHPAEAGSGTAEHESAAAVADIPAAAPSAAESAFTYTDLRNITGRDQPAGSHGIRDEDIVPLALTVITSPRLGAGRKLLRLAHHLELLDDRPAGHKPRLVMVTADGDLRHTSVVALGLAYAEFLADRRVLLVDANVEHPRLTRIMPSEHDHGIQSVITGRARLSDVISKRDGINLHFLPLRGSQESKLSVKINGASMKKLLGQAKDYDVVVVDVGHRSSASLSTMFVDQASQLLIAKRTAPTGDRMLLSEMRAIHARLPQFCGFVVTG